MLKIIIIFLALYSLACFFLYIKQRSILYFPTPESSQSNAQILWLQASAAKLKIWLLNKDENNQRQKAIIYFGGNSEAVEENIPAFKRMFDNSTVYVVNYRGYGGSTGLPTEQDLFGDALDIYDQLKSQYSSISVIGRSLGSGVACYLAANREVSKLVLTTPYDSIRNVAQSHYPMFPVKWLLKDHFDSAGYAASIDSEILVLYAEHDQVVPRIHTETLLKVLPDVKSILIKNASHNDISSNPEYQQLLAEFLN